MDTHPDIVRAISTALGAVAGSLTGDRTKGPEKGISGFIYAENTNSYNKGIAYLKQEGFTQDSAVSLFKEYNRYLRLGVDWKHPAVRLPGIQADVDKNHKVINSSGTQEIRMPNENNHLGSPHVWNDGRHFEYGWWYTSCLVDLWEVQLEIMLRNMKRLWNTY